MDYEKYCKRLIMGEQSSFELIKAQGDFITGLMNQLDKTIEENKALKCSL